MSNRHIRIHRYIPLTLGIGEGRAGNLDQMKSLKMGVEAKKYRSSLVLFLIVIFAALSVLNFSTTEVKGEYWDMDRTLTDNHTVPFGETLIILPGITISIETDVSIYVEGTLKAIGTESNPIRFISAPPTLTTWGTIKFNSSSTNNILDYVMIENATTGIFMDSASSIINHTSISNTTMNGFYAIGVSPLIGNSTITGTAGYDINVLDGGMGASVVTLNTKFDKDKVNIQGPQASLDVQWYLDVEVIDDHNDLVEDAQVAITDSSKQEIFDGYTDAQGMIPTLTCTEFIEYSDSRVYHTPYNITVVKQGFDVSYAQPEPVVDDTMKIIVVVADRTAPTSLMTMGYPTEDFNPTSVATTTSFSLSALDTASGVAYIEYRIDGGDWIRYKDSFDVTSLGHHNITYRSIDNAGNVETVKVLWINVHVPVPTANILLENIGIITIAIVAVTAFSATAATEYGKYGLVKLLVVPLYTRLKKEKVLDQFTRGKIYGYVLANPGQHYNSIKKALGLNNGALTYHLSVLIREKLIRAENEGMYKRFYPGKELMAELPTSIDLLNAPQRYIYEIIRGSPGISQKDISKTIGESNQVVNYHIKSLKEKGLIMVQYDGKFSQCFIKK